MNPYREQPKPATIKKSLLCIFGIHKHPLSHDLYVRCVRCDKNISQLGTGFCSLFC